MRVIAGQDLCPNANCPKVFDPATGDLLVQGYLSTDVAAPAGEAVVRVPTAVILEAAETLRAEAER